MPSRSGLSPEMNAPERGGAQVEERVRQIAATFPYPATPDLAAVERQRLARRPARPGWSRTRRLATALAVVAILLAALLVSPARARVLDWIRIGAVRIFFFLPTPTQAPPAPTGTPSPGRSPTPAATPTFLQSVLDLSGETTLQDAQEQAGFNIQLPAYPADLGEPAHVYLQEFNRKAVIMVWMDPDRPGQVRMSLTQTLSESYLFEKYAPRSVQDTQVNGDPGVWIDGEYVLVTRDGDFTLARLIDQGHTLIWSDGKMTFRLETNEELEEALKIAESIQEPSPTPSPSR